jgi:diguanylate cyclase (GGDEF)-like protein
MIVQARRTAVQAVAWVVCAAGLVVWPGEALAVQGLTGPAPRSVEWPWLGAIGGLVVSALLLLLYVYRRKTYILQWSGSWLLLAASRFLAIADFANEQVEASATGAAQFLAIASALVFVVSADSFRQRPRISRGYFVALLPLLIWFTLAPVVLGASAALVPGYLISAGVLAAAAFGYGTVLNQTRMLGAALLCLMFGLLAAVHVWMAALVTVGRHNDPDGVFALLFAMALLFVVAALGMHLMAFEDMTWELRQTNRQLEAAQAELRQLVVTDALTGCHNRRFFNEIISRELQRHERYHIPLSILFVDIDRFKAVNDSLGHEAGDRVLQSVSRFLVRSVREADYVFRWGGDEFLILISCSEMEALRKAVELQIAFEAAPEASAVPSEISLSIGCAEVPPGTTDVLPLVRLADERMYLDKARSKEVPVRH